MAGNACVYEISFVETATKIAPDKDREIALLGYNETFIALQAHFDLDQSPMVSEVWIRKNFRGFRTAPSKRFHFDQLLIGRPVTNQLI